MALSSNPTKTRTIEANWLREINKRWRLFTGRMIDALRAANDNTNGSNFPLINQGAVFDLSASQQRTFMEFMQLQIDRLLMASDQPPNWQAQYQLQSYQRGVESARRHLLAQSATLVRTAEEVAQAALLGDFTAVPSLGAANVTAPIHQDALEFLFTRSYDKLNGWTDAMATETRQILFDGVAQGKGIDDVVREMVKRIDVSRTRARVIARTEVIQAFQQSNTNEAERASEEIGEVILLRWLTVRDNRVRHLHATWHGTLATPKENKVRIGISPQNCRCGVAPVIPEANTKAKQKKFDKERKQLLMLERR